MPAASMASPQRNRSPSYRRTASSAPSRDDGVASSLRVATSASDQSVARAEHAERAEHGPPSVGEGDAEVGADLPEVTGGRCCTRGSGRASLRRRCTGPTAVTAHSDSASGVRLPTAPAGSPAHRRPTEPRTAARSGPRGPEQPGGQCGEPVQRGSARRCDRAPANVRPRCRPLAPFWPARNAPAFPNRSGRLVRAPRQLCHVTSVARNQVLVPSRRPGGQGAGTTSVSAAPLTCSTCNPARLSSLRSPTASVGSAAVAASSRATRPLCALLK